MRIAVIGWGLSRLTFAAAMRQRSPDAEVTLYEADATATSRPQGHAIGLRNATRFVGARGAGAPRRRFQRDLVFRMANVFIGAFRSRA